MDGSGNLYGTTIGGGAYDEGTVFELAKGSSTITTLASFNKPNEDLIGLCIPDSLFMDSNGNLYGTTEGSAGVPGTVFELQMSTNGNTAPVITTQPSSQTVTAGQTATFTAAASGTPTPTVQWQVSTDGGKTFTNISGATSTTLTLNNVTTAMNGYEYEAVFTNSVGTATTSAATLTVNAPPPPPAPPSPPPSPAPSAPPTLNTPPLLAFVNSLFGGGTETVNTNGSVTITDSFFGIPLLVSTFDSSGHLESVFLFGINARPCSSRCKSSRLVRE